jgi:hypothetical protein
MFALLATHPNIAMVRRTNAWRWFHNRFGDLSRSDNFERCLTTILRYKRMEHLQPDPKRIRAEFRNGAPTYGRLFRLIHEHHAERAGKSRWGDKSLHTEHHADRVFADFPGAKMIHMVRDPRDRYASIVKRYKNQTRGVASTTGRWVASIKRARRNLRQYPDNYMVVRYESLAQRPEDTLRLVCGFIGEKYTPAMLSMLGVPEYGQEGGNSSFERFEPGIISTRSIGRYRSVLSPHQIQFIQMCAGRGMAAFGYARDRAPTKLADRLAFYLAQLPVGMVRMRGWMAVEKLRTSNMLPPAHRLVDPPPLQSSGINYAK